MAQRPAPKNSLVGPSYGNRQNECYYSYNVTSPSNSDGNNYPSPLVSPGDWSYTPPSYNPAIVSPQSHGSFLASPSSAVSTESRSPPPSTPPSTPPSFQPPALPSDLGAHGQQALSAKSSKRAQGSITKGFMEKSAMDKEREKLANRRLQSMMIEATRNRTKSGAFGEKNAQAFFSSNGTEAYATSSRKPQQPMVMEDLQGSVDDFKCGHDRGRERAAKFHAMRIITRLDNAA